MKNGPPVLSAGVTLTAGSARLARHGDRVALCRCGELELVRTDFEPKPLPPSLVFLQNRLLSTRVRSFVDWMAKTLPASLIQESPTDL